MNASIKFTTVGTDAGPFDLYSDGSVPPFCCAFASGVTRAQLLAGYPSSNIPDSTTYVRAISRGDCTNYVDIHVPGKATTTSSTTAP